MSKAKASHKTNYDFMPPGPKVEVLHCPTCNSVVTCQFCGLQQRDCDAYHPEHDYTPTTAEGVSRSGSLTRR